MTGTHGDQVHAGNIVVRRPDDLEAFDALPDEAKERVFRRVWEVLAGVDRSGQFDHLSVMDRSAILEILRDTKEEFARWLVDNRAGLRP